nr:MAG TPA: hypothetical protein [Caudoviricetes sp.]
MGSCASGAAGALENIFFRAASGPELVVFLLAMF